MARMSTNRFIPFDKTKPEPNDVVQTPDNELLNLAIAISSESGKLLECVSNKESDNSRTFAIQLKNKLEQILSKIPAEKKAAPTNYVAYTGTTQMQEFKHISLNDYPDFVRDILSKSLKDKEDKFLEKFRAQANDKNNNRALDNGGMAPPDDKKISDLNLKPSEKYNLIEQMRHLKEQGITVSLNKSNYHHKSPISIEEFTEPFKYMENMHDYNGSFLITLIKSDIEISNQAATLQVDLRAERDACANGDKLLLSVYDITGSTSLGEEKKFLMVLLFDNLHGILKYDHSIFMNGKKCNLSQRQMTEIAKFCKSKKINI